MKPSPFSETPRVVVRNASKKKSLAKVRSIPKGEGHVGSISQAAILEERYRSIEWAKVALLDRGITNDVHVVPNLVHSQVC